MAETDSKPANASASFPFTNLPAELRCMIYNLTPTFSSQTHHDDRNENSNGLMFDYANKSAPYGQLQEDGKGLLLASRQLYYEFRGQYYKSAQFSFKQPESIRTLASRKDYFSELERHITSHATAFSHTRNVRFEINWSSFDRDDMVDEAALGAIRALLNTWARYEAPNRHLEIVFHDERKDKIWNIARALDKKFSIDQLCVKLSKLQDDLETLPQVANLRFSCSHLSIFGTRNMYGYVLEEDDECCEPLDVDRQMQGITNDVIEKFLSSLVITPV